ncbi:MAG: TIGR03936 family radical SAM-associated protein [Caldilineaceae bacterium]
MSESVEIAETSAEVTEQEKQRVRFTYAKGEAVKFISHQDEFRLWERTLRRAGLPLLYKQGFNPQPHMQFAAALGLGMTGVAEIVDVTFSPRVPLDELLRRVAEKLPPGVTVHGVEEVPIKAKALQSLTIGADYTILIYAEPGEIEESRLQAGIEGFLAKTEVTRTRERHGQPYEYNLRPLVFELRYDGYDAEVEEHRIFLRVQARDGATGRPDEVVDALGFDDFARTLRRDHIYYEHLEADAAVFAGYPVISQAEISPKRPKRQKKHKYRRKQQPRPEAEEEKGRQSFADKAADEFA